MYYCRATKDAQLQCSRYIHFRCCLIKCQGNPHVGRRRLHPRYVCSCGCWCRYWDSRLAYSLCRRSQRCPGRWVPCQHRSKTALQLMQLFLEVGGRGERGRERERGREGEREEGREARGKGRREGGREGGKEGGRGRVREGGRQGESIGRVKDNNMYRYMHGIGSLHAIILLWTVQTIIIDKTFQEIRPKDTATAAACTHVI